MNPSILDIQNHLALLFIVKAGVDPGFLSGGGGWINKEWRNKCEMTSVMTSLMKLDWVMEAANKEKIQL